MSDQAPIEVLIPTPLRRFTNGEARVRAAGGTVSELLDALEAAHPGLKERICEPDGEVRRFVNLFVNGDNVRDRDGVRTPLQPGDEVGIIPAMAGGRAG